MTADHAGAAGNHDPQVVPLSVMTDAGVSAHRIHWVIDLLTSGESALEKPHAVDESTS
jgi:hypothetical protein